MAGRAKHAERSHRSYHNPKPFGSFYQKASTTAANKAKRSLADSIKSFFHKKTGN